MKRIVVLLAAVFLLFPGIVYADDLTPSAPKVKIRKPELKTQQKIEPGQKPAGPETSKIRQKTAPGKKPAGPSPKMQKKAFPGAPPAGTNPSLKHAEPDKSLLFPAVEIQGMEFSTESNGRWKVSYMVENTGMKNLEANMVLYKSFQILKNGTRVPELAVTVGGPFTVGSVGGPTHYLDRCVDAEKLMLEVIYKGRRLDQKTVNLPPVNVKIKKWLLSKGGKNLQVTLQNPTQYTLKVALRMEYESSSTRIQSADTDIVVSANSTKTHTIVLQKWKKLKSFQVLYKSNKQCGGKNSLVLDSKTVQREFTIHGNVYGGEKQPKFPPPTSQKTNIQPGPGDNAAVIESIRWWRYSRRWESTIRNVSDQPVYITVERRFSYNYGPGYTDDFYRVLYNKEIQAGKTRAVGENLHGVQIREGESLVLKVISRPEYETDTNYLTLE